MNLKSATSHFGCRFAVKSYFWPLLCYDMRTRAIKNVFSVYKFPFPHQALKGLYAVVTLKVGFSAVSESKRVLV